jgi:hypothetical protein
MSTLIQEIEAVVLPKMYDPQHLPSRDDWIRKIKCATTYLELGVS